MMRTILDWSEEKDKIIADIDGIIARATAVDGVTGEKGMADYSSMTIQRTSEFLVLYNT